MIRFDFLTLQGHGRTGGALDIEALVTYDPAGQGPVTGRNILEGTFDLSFSDGLQEVARFRTSTLSLTVGQQRIRFTVPPFHAGNFMGELNVRPQFLTEFGSVPVDQFLLQVPRTIDREQVVGFSDPLGGTVSTYGSILKGLRLELFNPVEEDQFLRTFPARVPPESFGTTPLSYCAYDVLVLAGEGFAIMTETQLHAVETWVRAGGALAVVPDGVFEPYHLTFLNRLATLAGSDVLIAQAEGGQIAITPDAWDARAHLLDVDLGRVALLTRPPLDDTVLTTPEWRRIACFLWRVRAGQTEHIVANGKWDPDQQAAPAQMRAGPQVDSKTPRRISVGPETIAQAQTIEQMLTPSNVRLVPLSVIIVILGSFLLIIGPVDYFVLGLFRQRRWTWLTLPVIAALFALLTLNMARSYMGTDDVRRSFTIYDVGTDEQILRKTTYELVLSSFQADVESNPQQTAVTPVPPSQFRSWLSPNYRGTSLNASIVPLYAGRYPGNYELTYRLPQWQSVVTRSFILAPAEQLPVQVDWEKVRTAATSSLDLGNLLFRQDGNSHKLQWIRGQRSFMSAAPPELRFRSGEVLIMPQDCVVALSARPCTDFFALVAQHSPSGSGSDCFEDLALIDGTDPTQAALVLLYNVDGNYICIRRKYQIVETSDGPR